MTCLDLGAWGALFKGWDRQVKLVGEEAKALKRQINSQWVYPSLADRAVAPRPPPTRPIPWPEREGTRWRASAAVASLIGEWLKRRAQAPAPVAAVRD